MSRLIAAIASCLLLTACVVQPSRPYYGGGYGPSYYPAPYAGNGYPAPGYAPQAYAPRPYASQSYPPRSYPPQSEPSEPYPTQAYPAESQALPPDEGPAQAPPAGEGPIDPRANFAEESTDYGVPPTTSLHLANFDAPTPTQIEGAKTVTTGALRQMLASDRPPILVDVIGGQQSVSLPGAIWMRGAGVGRHIDDDIQAWFDYNLSKYTGGDKSRPLAIFCASRLCWLAHNATLRAVDLGYSEVYWYRGGRDSWQAAGLPMAPVAPPPQ